MSHHVHQDGPVCTGCNAKAPLVHPRLWAWFLKKKAKYTNLHCAWGFRNKAEQDQANKDKTSVLVWPHSPHNRLVPTAPEKLYRPEIWPNPSSNARPESAAVDLFLLDEDGVARWPMPFYEMLSEEIKEDRDPIAAGVHFVHPRPDGPHFELTPEGLKG